VTHLTFYEALIFRKDFGCGVVDCQMHILTPAYTIFSVIPNSKKRILYSPQMGCMKKRRRNVTFLEIGCPTKPKAINN
jgi:hypothetical protein